MAQQSSKCIELNQQYRELQKLKAEFDRELERAAMTKITNKALALKHQLEQAHRELKENIPELSDVDYFNYIKTQVESGRELSAAGLRFLYKGLMSEQYFYNYLLDRKDHISLNEIRKQRNIRQDFAKIYGVKETEVIEAFDELNHETKVYCGKFFNQDETLLSRKPHFFSYKPSSRADARKIKQLAAIKHLPLDLTDVAQAVKDQLTCCEGTLIDHNTEVSYPALQRVSGSFIAHSAAQINIGKLINVGNNIDLARLTTAVGLELPASIGGYLNLNSLTSADGLELPASIGRDLNLYSLTSANRLKLPASIGGNLDLSSLESVDELELPQHVGGNVYLQDLDDSEWIMLKNKYPNLRIINLE